MRYKIHGEIIRSENAAKPISQASQYLSEWLIKHSSFKTAVDYGCGKLRYSGILASKCGHLVLVDSEIQLIRNQRLDGTFSNIYEYACEKWPNTRILTSDQFDTHKGQYEFFLCSNVLSAIPSVSVRAHILQTMLTHLSDKGTALITTQYRNSYFNQIIKSQNATPYDQGWLLRTKRGTFYYGIIMPKTLNKFVEKCGFSIHSHWTHKGSAYVLCGKNSL